MHYLNNNDYNYTENYSREFNINRFMKDYLSSSKIFEKLKPEIAKITKSKLIKKLRWIYSI